MSSCHEAHGYTNICDIVDAKMMNATGRDPLPDAEINGVSAGIRNDSWVMTSRATLPEIGVDSIGRAPIPMNRIKLYTKGRDPLPPILVLSRGLFGFFFFFLLSIFVIGGQRPGLVVWWLTKD